MSDTSNDLGGQAETVVQAGSAGSVNTGTQHVGNGIAVQGDVNGGINLTITTDETQ